VDDVVVKTQNPDTLIADLEETFASLREYQWKLNPNKCIFGIPSGKLLCFIISHRGIEANPEKISAITKMKAPTCIKDVQKLTWCMEALNRFISKLGERGLLFFKLLKHQEKFMWTQRQIKLWLSSRTSCPSLQSSRLLAKRRSYCSTSLRLLTWSVLPSSSSDRKTATPTQSSDQLGPVGIQGTIPTSTKATICSAHHLVDVTTILPGVLDHRRHRLPARRHLTEPGCY
jgi:hypothetical protein